MLNYNKIYLILATLLGINLYFNFLPAILLIITGVTLIFLAALAYGEKIKPEAGFLTKICFGILGGLIVVSITGALFFYFASLGKFAVIFILFFIFLKTRNTNIEFSILNFKFLKSHTTYYILHTTYLLFAAAFIFFAVKSSSANLIQSPWLELPKYLLLLFFIGTLLLIFLLNKLNKKNLGWPIVLHFFIFFSIAGFIYKFGYGFDQFVHEATQKYILAHGTITPKPTQYIGFYSINIFINYISGISIEILDKFLLPALAAITIPIIHSVIASPDASGRGNPVSDEIAEPVPSMARDLSPRNGGRTFALPLLGLLLLPLSYFIVSTPQGLANLLLLIFVCLGLNGYKKLALPLAIFAIHPITGIIALVYAALLKYGAKKKLLIAGAFALPLAFALLSYKLSGRLLFSFDAAGAFRDYWSLLTFGGLKQNFNFWFDIIYLIQYLILPAVALISIYAARACRKEISQYPLYLFWIATANFFITRIFIDFSYLIGYEQKNYSERIFYISFLFLAPYLIFAASRAVSFLRPVPRSLGEVGKQESLSFKLFFACLFAFLITSNFYLTYPRWDNYQNDKGKNVASFMMEAVQKIKQDAGNKNYVVLTDQTVSAAALYVDGFKKYYKTPLGEVFYYPIPTGGPLYNEFLNLVYNNAGSRAARNSRALSGANIAYVALPSYWENYEKIKENLKIDMQVVFEDKDIVILK